MLDMTDRVDHDEEPPSSTDGAPRQGGHLHVVHDGEVPPARKAHPFLAHLKETLFGQNASARLQETLSGLIDEDDPGPPLDSDEKEMISNILDLRDMRAFDVMIPRADIVAIDAKTSPQDLFTLLAEKQFSRFPVYKETLDDVIGTLHIKDIMACIARGEAVVIENLVRDVTIVSPAIHVLDLLLDMKTTRRHMALVVDEFGGIDGLVTVGDIVESIIGDIEDEHDSTGQPQLSVMADGTILADGRVDIETFEERFGEILNDEERQDIDTLGGLVFAVAGHVPARGEVISHDSGLVFEILDADPRRVHRLRIKNIPKEPVAE